MVAGITQKTVLFQPVATLRSVKDFSVVDVLISLAMSAKLPSNSRTRKF
jgi:hypothetical protein